MEVDLSREQGEATSRTVVLGVASVGPSESLAGDDERVGVDAMVTLICAGWSPQDGCSAGVDRSSNVERDPDEGRDCS